MSDLARLCQAYGNVTVYSPQHDGQNRSAARTGAWRTASESLSSGHNTEADTQRLALYE